MPGYVEKVLMELNFPRPKRKRESPSKDVPLVYGQKMQYANTDKTRPLSDEEITDVKRITKRFHYYANAVDATMLHALDDINCKVSEGIATADTLEALKFFLSYASWNTDASILFRASDMTLRIDSDGAHLVFPRSRSRAGGYHYLGDKDGTIFNAPIRVLTKLIPLVTASAAETELHSVCQNAFRGLVLRDILRDMGHPQDTTPIKTDNSTVNGIIDKSMKARYLKADSNRLKWIREKVDKGIFEVHWESAKTNLADYPTKHHSPTHHRTVRPIYTYQSNQSPTTMQGCVNILEGLTKTRHPTAKAVTEAPAKQEMTKKRSCNPGKPISIHTNEAEDASLYKGASALAALRNGPTKKQRTAKGPRALSLRPISTYKRHGETTRTQSPTRHRRLKSITGFSSRRWHNTKESSGSANQSHQLQPVPSYSAST